LRSTDLLALPTCDPDKTFAVQIGHEETMVSGSVAYVQCALLHTSSNGERRIRCGLCCAALHAGRMAALVTGASLLLHQPQARSQGICASTRMCHTLVVRP
jgi:hypothetical protein